MSTDILTWIEQALDSRTCTTGELWYDHMASQSDRHLAVIYQPFDVNNRGHSGIGAGCAIACMRPDQGECWTWGQEMGGPR